MTTNPPDRTETSASVGTPYCAHCGTTTGVEKVDVTPGWAMTMTTFWALLCPECDALNDAYLFEQDRLVAEEEEAEEWR